MIMGKSLDLDGQRFGMLIATNCLKVIPHASRGCTVRLCHCDCGNETWTVTTKLRNRHTTSCGCNKFKGRSLKPGRAARNQILDGYRRGATKRGLEWDLTENEFDQITSMNCFYCGQPPSKEKIVRGNNGSFFYNGIDRKDNTNGYFSDNVLPCCFICNRAKRAMSFDEFILWLDNMAQHRGVKCGF